MMSLDFFFCGNKLLVNKTGASTAIPDNAADFPAVEKFQTPDGKLVGAVHDVESECNVISACGARWMTLRDIFDRSQAEIYGLAQQAYQVLYWRRNFRFCSRCGGRLEHKTTSEHAMRCEKCGIDYFARINPAIIVCVTRGDKILLARRQSGTGAFYSVLAGFVEPGETFEQTVVREVREEVGLDVSNIRYLASQPWPFPNNIMVGFSAECASGEIKPDGVEIKEAGWFSKDTLPDSLPRKMSIAHLLIDDFLKTRKDRL